MKLVKEDLINKIECLISYLRHENTKKIDKTFYNDLCDEAQEFCNELKENEVTFTN